jgi:hypothetical protein
MTTKVDKVNLKIYEHENYVHEFQVYADEEKTIAGSIAGFTAKLEFRASPSSTDVLFTATTANGYLTVGASSVTLDIPGDVVGDWTFRNALYDLFVISPSGRPTPIVKGGVSIVEAITQF